MQHLVWSDTLVSGGSNLTIKLKRPEFKQEPDWGQTGRAISFYKDMAVLAVPAEKKEITTDEVLNLSAQFDQEKGLKWNAPAGKWIVYRMGHATTGAEPHPVPDELIGKVLEADKMSVEQSTWHWNNVIQPVRAHLGEYIGKSFRHMLIDSYEAGGQNWTPGFREEFIKRKGYDPIPWLVSFSPVIRAEKNSKDTRIVGSKEQTTRFDRDYKDVIDQLFFDNGWSIAKKMLKEAKLDLQFEPYTGPFSTARGAALADIPMAEFWTSGKGGVNPVVVAAARAAGKTVVGAEAYTGRPEVSQYTEDPAFLKSSTDLAFSQGINRMILHHWVHQPFDDKYQPGMGMGWWGTHFSRHQTWFEPGKAFFSYLARCQALLQYGEQPADYLSVDRLDGFSDLISVNDFLKSEIQVRNGKVVLPSGRSYAFVIFPDGEKMLPEVAQKIKLLVAAGAVVVSPKPISSPSLKDFPECDEQLKQIAAEVWGENLSNQYKKGFIFVQKEDAIAKTGITPAFLVDKAANTDEIRIAYRQSTDADIFFVANLSDKAQQAELSFRISGKQPELWQAEDGCISNAPVWDEKNGRTSVSLGLKGNQSVFVVFRKKALFASGKQETLTSNTTDTTEIKGPWKVTFAPKLEQSFDLDFPELIDFSKHTNKSVNYFAGTATYRKQIKLNAKALGRNKRIVLDLGEVNDIAEVRVNGKSAGVLWYPPYSVDITSLLRKGENSLEILVTTNWANRLIGDEQEPADFEWGNDRGENLGRAMQAYPEWFISNQPRPSKGRKTFSVWYYYRKDSPLKPAGLVGPVRLVNVQKIKL
jgi:hypothetical protein